MPENKIVLRPEDIAEFWPPEKSVSVDTTAEQQLDYNGGDDSTRFEVLSQLVELHIFRKTAQNPRGQLVHQCPPPLLQDELVDVMRGTPPVSGAYIVQVKATRGGKFLGQCTHYLDTGDAVSVPLPGYQPQFQQSPLDDKIGKLIELMTLQTMAAQQAPKENSTIELIKALSPMMQRQDSGSAGKEVAAAVGQVISTVMASKSEIEKITTLGAMDMKRADQAHQHQMELTRVQADKDALLERIRLQNEKAESAVAAAGEGGEYLQWDDGSNLKKLAEVLQEILPVGKEGGGMSGILTDMVLPVVSELNDYLARRDLLIITRQQLESFQHGIHTQGYNQGMETAIKARTTGDPPPVAPVGPGPIQVQPLTSTSPPASPQPPVTGANDADPGT